MTTSDLKLIASRALSMLDLTSLNDGDTETDVFALCERAKTNHGNVAAVCVWPRFVELAKECLTGSDVKVAAVANFPTGEPDVNRAVADTAEVVDAGGDEVDVVFPYRAFLGGDYVTGARLINDCKTVCGVGVSLKVIIETGELNDPLLIRQASLIALQNGADFIKTSTGKVPENATLAAAEVMLTAIQDHGSGRFKAAGGIRDTKTAGAYLGVADRIMGPEWATPDTFRFGASGVITDLLAVLDGQTNVVTGEGY